MNPFLADVRRTADQAILDGLRPPPPVDYEKWAIDNVSFSDRESQFTGPYNPARFRPFTEIYQALSPARALPDTIDAPYAPGNRGLWRKAKWLNRQEFVIVGWSDPEGARPHLGALLLGYYSDDGKLIYAGRVRFAARPVARALGRAEDGRRNHLFDVDRRQPFAAHGLRRPSRR